MMTINNSKHDSMHDLHHGAETELICLFQNNNIIFILFLIFFINNNKQYMFNNSEHDIFL